MDIPNKRPLGRPIQQQDSISTSDQILHSASVLFMEKGFENVSMNQVADHSGVTKATVYYYFPTKTDLFVASIVGVLTRVNERIEHILQGPGSFQERLLKISVNYLKVPQIHMDDMFGKIKQHLSEEQQNQLIHQEDALYQTLCKGFEEAARQQEIVCSDPNLAAHIYVSMLRIGERQYTGRTKLFETREEAAESIISFLWRGIHN